jgi:hypothetical protein
MGLCDWAGSQVSIQSMHARSSSHILCWSAGGEGAWCGCGADSVWRSSSANMITSACSGTSDTEMAGCGARVGSGRDTSGSRHQSVTIGVRYVRGASD